MKQLLCISIFLIYLSTYSQQKYWIYFQDKSDTIRIPSGFSEAAIQRRKSQQQDWHFSDYPLNYRYIEKIRCYVDSLSYESRWLNAVSAWIHPDNLSRILSYPFVKKVEPVELYQSLLAKKSFVKKEPTGLNKLAELQINQLGAYILQEKQLDGRGIRICIIDAGFSGAKESPGLKHLWEREAIASTFDFIRKKDDVFTGSSHGTYVLSCLAGKTETMQTGLATGATYLLARTESLWSENLAEEDRWIAALEWADREGAHIINCSMGYARPKYKKIDLNGKSRLSMAMNMASDKGMLIINAAGNEYHNSWKTLIIPADAEKVLTVGAIQTKTGEHAWFSSTGPTADGRIKPELTAPGTVVAWEGRKTVIVSGTSFSAPLIAGLAACIWQNRINKISNYDLKQLLIESGCWWPDYDHRLGYGIPVIEIILFNYASDIKWEIVTDSMELKIQFSEPLLKNEKLYYKIEKQPGEFELYGFIEMEKGITKATIPWKTFFKTNHERKKDIKSYSGKIFWVKWRNQQKQVIIP